MLGVSEHIIVHEYSYHVAYKHANNITMCQGMSSTYIRTQVLISFGGYILRTYPGQKLTY